MEMVKLNSVYSALNDERKDLRGSHEFKGTPTLVFFPGKLHRQRSLQAGYSPWGHKTVGHDLTKQQHFKQSCPKAVSEGLEVALGDVLVGRFFCVWGGDGKSQCHPAHSRHFIDIL